LSDRNYYSEILATKQTEKITYSKIASWMDLTESNLRAMIYLKLNPTAKEWNLFRAGLRNYIENKNSRIFKIPTIICPIHGVVHLGSCKLTFSQKLEFSDMPETDKIGLLEVFESLNKLSELKELREAASGESSNYSFT